MKTKISEYEQQAIDFLKATGTTFKSTFAEYGRMPWDTKGDKRNIFNITLTNEKSEYSFRFGSSIANSTKPVSVLKIDTDEPATIYTGFSHIGMAKGVTFGHKITTTYKTIREIKNGQKPFEDLINEVEFQKDYKEYQESLSVSNKKIGKWEAATGASEGECLARVRSKIREAINAAKTETFTKYEQADTVKHPTSYDVLTCLTKYDPGTFEEFCGNYGYDEDSRKAEQTYNAVVEEWEEVSELFTSEELELLQEIQ